MAKRHEQCPEGNDWLYSCPVGTTTRRIAAKLMAEHLAHTEVSARGWYERRQMANDLLAAWGYPTSFQVPLGREVSWDGLRDWLFLGPNHAPEREGELLVVRDCHPSVAPALSFFLSIIQADKDSEQRLIEQKPHEGGPSRVLVVLEGWESPVLEAKLHIGRSHRRYCWIVNPLM